MTWLVASLLLFLSVSMQSRDVHAGDIDRHIEGLGKGPEVTGQHEQEAPPRDELLPPSPDDDPFLKVQEAESMFSRILEKVWLLCGQHAVDVLITSGLDNFEFERDCLQFRRTMAMPRQQIGSKNLGNPSSILVYSDLQDNPDSVSSKERHITGTDDMLDIGGFSGNPVDWSPYEKRAGHRLSVNGALNSLADMLKFQSRRRNRYRLGHKNKLLKMG